MLAGGRRERPTSVRAEVKVGRSGPGVKMRILGWYWDDGGWLTWSSVGLDFVIILR